MEWLNEELYEHIGNQKESEAEIVCGIGALPEACDGSGEPWLIGSCHGFEFDGN